MGIDTIINYPCIPKEQFSAPGILGRIKGRERALQVIRMYRDNGDQRPPSQIGFEVTRRSSDGNEETRLVLASELLADAGELETVAHYCEGCPANRTNRPFGCIGYVGYPISTLAEVWLLKQLPNPEMSVLFSLIRHSITEFGYTGGTARQLRDQNGVFFENADTLARQFPEITVTTDQIFEMTFMLGPIQPGHGMMLLLFFNAVPRDNVSPNDIMLLTMSPPAPDVFAERFPFRLAYEPNDDNSTREIKAFLESLYIAYKLQVTLVLDI